jgi:hypothetical protein
MNWSQARGRLQRPWIFPLRSNRGLDTRRIGLGQLEFGRFQRSGNTRRLDRTSETTGLRRRDSVLQARRQRLSLLNEDTPCEPNQSRRSGTGPARAHRRACYRRIHALLDCGKFGRPGTRAARQVRHPHRPCRFGGAPLVNDCNVSDLAETPEQKRVMLGC